MVVLHLLVFIVTCHTDQCCHGHDPMVVGFTTTYATKVVSSNPAHGVVYSIQHYVIKFVSDFRQVNDFFRIHQFPSPINLTATI